jgi:hypothetical protein
MWLAPILGGAVPFPAAEIFVPFRVDCFDAMRKAHTATLIIAVYQTGQKGIATLGWQVGKPCFVHAERFAEYHEMSVSHCYSFSIIRFASLLAAWVERDGF